MKTQAIVNPKAGGGTTNARWPLIHQVLQDEGFQHEVVFTEHAGQASDLARQAHADGFELVVAVGGDGHIHGVVNGLLADRKRGQPNPGLAIIPTGTAGDLAKTLGLPRDPAAAARQLAQSKYVRDLDVGLVSLSHDGKVSSRYFTNVAGLGLDGAIVSRLDRRGKLGSGTLPYLLGLLAVIGRYRNTDTSLQIDGRPFQRKVNSVFVCNGQYFGGAMRVAPQSLVDDGQLDVVVLGDLWLVEILFHLPKLYRGKHLAHRKVSFHRARTVAIEPAHPMPAQADGEYLGAGSATFEILPGKLRLYGCPPPTSNGGPKSGC